jgi:alanine dehydrogenase
MLIGVPKEIKNNEFRVGLVPAAVAELAHQGHKVLIETGAGMGSGFSDQHYQEAGGEMIATAQQVYADAEMIVKVKEPQAVERAYLSAGQVLFTYLHLAPDPQQTEELLASGAIAIGYETVTDDQGHLPLLAPMSEVAGRLSIQAGAQCLEKVHGGRGVLLGGVPGVEPARVVIIGGGVVGANAAQMAVGLRADVTLIDRSLAVLRRHDQHFSNRLKTLYSTRYNIEHCLASADLVIGSVLIPGASAPKLITADLIKRMQPGSVLVDVAIDQGGCAETARPTTHENPTYLVDEVVHYCVANMPGAVARTSTLALNNATLPYVLALANHGVEQALRSNHHLRNGLNIYRGQVTCQAVAEALKLQYVPAEQVLEG